MNDERPFPYEKFTPKSTFNTKNKDTYLSCLEERLLEIDISSKRFNNLTREEGMVMVVWASEDY